MKKIIVLCSLMITLGFVATGCGGSKSAPAPAPAPPAVENPAEEPAADADN